MPRLSAFLTRLAWGVSAMLMFSTASSWAQSPPTLPPGYAESPEFRARLEAAAANSTLEPWQREFMQGLVGAGAPRTVGDVAPSVIGAVDPSGEWDQHPPPTARFGHTAIYDPVRDRMVVFAGQDSSSLRNDVWVLFLSGTPAWSALSPTGTPPPGRSGHTAIYDPVRDRMVVFGGSDGSSYRNDAWALSLSGTPAWSALSPTGTPPTGRYGHTAIYDPVRDRMVVFDGHDGSSYRNDVWALSLSGTPAWNVLSPTGAPPTARGYHTAIYDPVRDRMVVFGGSDGSSYPNDVRTLSLSGTPAWSALSSTGTPPTARAEHTAIYDPVRDRMVVFGGYNVDNGGHRNDTWALSLSSTPAWSALSPTGTPPGRSGHTAIYDPVRDRMVVFGGSGGFPSFRNGVWALSLSGTLAWSELIPTGTPPTGRIYHTAIYDPVRDRMVVFGGYDGFNFRSDVWALSLSGTPAWSALSPTGTPPTGRYGHTAIYDPVRNRMVIFAGYDGSSYRNDVWALSLSVTPAWNVLSPTGAPPIARGYHTAIYDPVRDRMVVFDGSDGSSYRNDVWALSLSGTPAWSVLSPMGTPPTGRESHTAIYDPVRDRMVVFDGSNGSILNDVWALSLAGTPAWSALSPTGTPPTARDSHTAIYDPVRDRMIVFGGYDGSFRNDVWRLNWSSFVAVDPLVPPVSLRFEFAPPRPNPSRGSVSFDISIPHDSPVSLVVYDSAGRVVHRVADAPFAPGRHVLVWDRRNDDGRVVPSGIYFVRLQAPGVLLTRKTILIQ